MVAVDPSPRGEAVAPSVPAPVLRRSASIERIPYNACRFLLCLAGELWGGDVDPGALAVSRLKGAMTNEVFRITWPGGEGDPRKVLVRIYGLGIEVFFDRADKIPTTQSTPSRNPSRCDREVREASHNREEASAAKLLAVARTRRSRSAGESPTHSLGKLDPAGVELHQDGNELVDLCGSETRGRRRPMEEEADNSNGQKVNRLQAPGGYDAAASE